VTPACDAVYYISARKRPADAAFPFVEVARVLPGQLTSVFGRQARA
jgi:hypothetical protein